MDIDMETLLGGLGGGHGGGGGGIPGRSQTFNYGDRPGGSNKRGHQDKTIEKDIMVSLEDIAKGCDKKMKITRSIHGGDGTVGKVPADIAFIIRDKPHPLFVRDGHNIKYTYKIPLREALCGTVLQVPTLEGKKVGVNCVGEVIKPTTTKRLQGYGLPLPKEAGKRGDLVVEFDIH